MKEEELISGLRDRLGKTGLSDRTVAEYGSRLFASLGGKDADEAFYEMHVGNLKTLAGNLSAEIAEQLRAQREAKEKEWEDAWKSGRKNAVSEDSGDAMDYPSLAGELSAVREELRSLREESDARRAAEESAALLDRVRGRRDELRVANVGIWDDAVSESGVRAGESEESVLCRAKDAYEAKVRRYMGEGSKPYRVEGPGGGGRGGVSLDAFFGRMADAGRFPQAD